MSAVNECYPIAFMQGVHLDSDESLADWCDANIELPQGRHAEAGKWRTSRTPFLREIMERMSPGDTTDEVVVMKGAQLGLTQTAVHWCGYVMKCAPASILFVEPTTDVAKKVSKQRIQPMLDNTTTLSGIVKGARSRDSGNTMLVKEFIGGDLVITGANSGVGLRFMSARYLVLDEEDGYPGDVDGEGPPSELAKNRLSTFARSKTLRMSTPLDASTSVIEPAYMAGSRGHFHVPCPMCLNTQWLKWSQVIFTFDGVKDLSRTTYQCEHCKELIAEHHKTFMLEAGQWVHDDPENPVKSYHISSLYAPYGWTKVNWAALAKEFVFAAHKAKSGDFRYLKKFDNTKLAETWQDQGEKVEQRGLYARREQYAATCPAGVLLLTCAIDVQDSWVESLIVGWGIDEESWMIARKRFDGSPSDLTLWNDLAAWIQERRTHELGVAVRVEFVTVDTRGHHAKEAHEFVRRYRGGRIRAIQGSTILGAPLIPVRPGTSKKWRGAVYSIGTVAAKDTLFQRFKIDQFGPGYIHYPMIDEFDEEFFAQLTSEEKKKKFHRGVLLGHYYEKKRARNEALDLLVYNMAALMFLNPALTAMSKRIQRHVEHAAEAVPNITGEPPTIETAQEPEPETPRVADPGRIPQRIRRPGGFVKSWR